MDLLAGAGCLRRVESSYVGLEKNGLAPSFRRCVERVDYVSGVGFPGGRAGRRRLGLERGGPAWVVTPRCVFDFDEDAGRIRVRSIHPGVTPAEVQAATGFDLGDLAGVPVTAVPTPAELDLLRHRVDPRDILLPRAA